MFYCCSIMFVYYIVHILLGIFVAYDGYGCFCSATFLRREYCIIRVSPRIYLWDDMNWRNLSI